MATSSLLTLLRPVSSRSERRRRLWIARAVHEALNLAREARCSGDLPRAHRWLVAVRALRNARDI